MTSLNLARDPISNVMPTNNAKRAHMIKASNVNVGTITPNKTTTTEDRNTREVDIKTGMCNHTTNRITAGTTTTTTVITTSNTCPTNSSKCMKTRTSPLCQILTQISTDKPTGPCPLSFKSLNSYKASLHRSQIRNTKIGFRACEIN